MARVKATEAREEDPLIKDAREYSFLKQQIDFLEKQQKEVLLKQEMLLELNWHRL